MTGQADTPSTLRPGWVYYALSATAVEQRIKIGFSRDVRARMRNPDVSGISAGVQRPIVIAVEAGSMLDEAARHVEFAALHLGGEWFRYVEPLRGHIERLTSQVADALKGEPITSPIGDALAGPMDWERL